MSLIEHDVVSVSASGDSGEFDLTGVTAIDVALNCSEIEGTSPTLDVVIQEAASQGAAWTTVATFTQLTAIGSENIGLVVLTKPIIQIKWTISAGDGPYTFKVTADTSAYIPSLIVVDPGDAGAIPVDRSGHCALVTAGAETRTLADASAAGLTLDLFLKTDGGDCVITAASPIDQSGTTVLTMDAVGQYVRLVSVDDAGDFEWRVTGMDIPTYDVIADPGDAGAIPVTRSGRVPIVTAAAETRTLADAARAGLTLDLYCKTYAVGDAVVTTASPCNQAGNNTLTFDTVGDFVRLVSIEDGADFEWRIVVADGVTPTTV